MIVINKLLIHNFNSIEDIEFDFNQGMHLILGKNKDSDFTDSNGSGKSSIIEALVYALYGKSLKSNHQRKGTDDTYVKLSMYVDSKYVEIVRYYNHFKNKNKVELYIDGENTTLHTQKQTQNLIQKLIRMPYEHFVSSICIIQGFPVKLLQLTPTKRKDYFIDLIDFDFDEVMKRIKLDILSISEELDNLNKEKNELEKRYSNIEGKLSVYLSQENIQIDDNNIKELQSELKEKENQYNTVVEALNILTEKYNKQKQEYIKQKTSLELQLNQLKSIIENNECPVCHSKITDEVKHKYNNLLEELEKLTKEESKFEVFEENIKEFTEKKQTLIQEKTKLLEKLKQLLNQLKISQEYKDNISKLMKEKEDIGQKLEELEDKIFKLEDDKARLTELYKLLSPSGEIRGIILQNYIDLYNQILSSILSNLNQDKFKFIINDNGIEVEGLEYNSLSGGEKRKVDIITQLAFSDFLSVLNAVDFNIRIYDEVFDNLDKKAQTHILEYILEVFYDRALYFISHNETLKSYFQDILIVEKENGISKLIKQKEGNYEETIARSI